MRFLEYSLLCFILIMYPIFLCNFPVEIPVVESAILHTVFKLLFPCFMDLFAEETDTDNGKVNPLSFEQYQKLIAQLGKWSKDAMSAIPKL